MKDDFRAVAWRKSEDNYEYTIQIESSSSFKVEMALKELSWIQTAEGFNSKTKKKIYIVERAFKSKEEWVKFAKSLSFKLSEISDRTGKERIINEG